MNDAYNSFKSGEYKPNQGVTTTIADELAANIEPLNLEILRKYATDVLTVSEEEI